MKPEDALSSFELTPGFDIELVVSEPLISDPIDMEIDEFGHLYVVEMPGYPLDRSGLGRIKLLRDANQDGRFDSASVFADGLTMPFGIVRWKKGLILTDAPDVLYLEDTTGDGIADLRRVLLTGFAFSNPQMNVGNPIYGLDNWVYLTSESTGSYKIYNEVFGYSGDEIHFPNCSESPRLALRETGRTVRFKPDSYELELTSGITQFGQTFDIWGRRILGNNSNHIYHEVIADQYLRRNQDLIVSEVSQTLTDHGVEVFPITHKPEYSLLTNIGVFTSACGVTAYNGGIFPDPYNTNAFFIAEPVGNIVHADLLTNQGVSFKASRFRQGKEFLASTDAWFRPVNMYVGPDGAIYVLDYYRKIIEHPEWMSEKAINAGGFYAGNDMGRIYRITPANSKPAGWIKGIELGSATDMELIAQLENTNHWWRINAQRLLVTSGSSEIGPDLIEMAKHSKSHVGRLHALWTLEGLGKLTPSLVSHMLKDTVAGIRENAIRLAEGFLTSNSDLIQNLCELKDDPDPRVRFQLLCTLGFIDTPQANKTRDNILIKDINDKWVQIAALTASYSKWTELLDKVIYNSNDDAPAFGLLVEKLATLIGTKGTPGTIRQLILEAITIGAEKPITWQDDVLEGLSVGLKNPLIVTEREQEFLVSVIFNHPSDTMRRAALRLIKVTGIENESLLKSSISKAVALIQKPEISEEVRADAIIFLTLTNLKPYTNLLKKLIIPSEPLSVQVASLNTLSKVPGLEVTHFIISKWDTLTTEIRYAVFDNFLERDEQIRLWLDALESGIVDIESFDYSNKVKLMTQPDSTIRSRARILFSKNNGVEYSYDSVSEIKGKATSGKIIFEQYCSSCHQINGKIGIDFGPDLGTTLGWSIETIITNIVDPNLSIAIGYDLWEVELIDGEKLTGIITKETPLTISIKRLNQEVKSIQRENIKIIRSLNISAMPGGFDEIISLQEMADLLTFLKTN